MRQQRKLQSLCKVSVRENHPQEVRGQRAEQNDDTEQVYVLKLIPKRDKSDIPGKVMTIEYDPNRSAYISLINYADGDKRYILSPVGLKVNDYIVAGEKVPLKNGNAMQLVNIPTGLFVHNIELVPGRGGQVVRSAGTENGL